MEARTFLDHVSWHIKEINRLLTEVEPVVGKGNDNLLDARYELYELGEALVDLDKDLS